MIKIYVANKTAYPTSESYIRSVLETFYGITAPTILKTENGKPYLENNPVHFSLSHTKEKIFLAVANFPVGIDAEKSDRIIDETVAKRYFHAERFESPKALLRKWIKTESKVKFLGSTLAKELSHPTEQELFFSFHETDDHVVCVCSEDPVLTEYIFL